jgi:hypothetical protein
VALNRGAVSCFEAKTPSKPDRSTTTTSVGAHRSGNSGRTGRSGAARGGETSRRLGAWGGLGKVRAARTPRVASARVRGRRAVQARSRSNLSVCPCLTVFSSKVFN